MKKIGLILCMSVLVFSTNIFSQDQSKDVTITSSGSADTQEKAKQVALRSAIEQAFGTFISARTEILNDEMVSDEITSVASGNIKSYEVLNEAQLPDGRWGVTVKSLVSVDKLTTFVQAKGVEIEIKGGLFALNIKQQLLNEQGEMNVIQEMVGLLHETMQTAFDYEIKSSDPKSLDAESKNWEIPLFVTATTNENIDFCANYCIKTLAALSLSYDEATSYKSLNKAVFPVVINYNGVAKTFYLRRQASINALSMIQNQWKFYSRLFTVQSGMDESNGIELERIHKFSSSKNNTNDDVTINFLTTGQRAATFSWQDKRTLSQIEQMTGYKVKPSGVVSQFKHGGFVIYEKDGHGLVASILDLGIMDWNSAKTACNELVLNGYSDWYLPSLEELKLLELFNIRNGNFLTIFRNGFKSEIENTYWSSTESTGNYAWKLYFGSGYQGTNSMASSSRVRAVRAF